MRTEGFLKPGAISWVRGEQASEERYLRHIRRYDTNVFASEVLRDPSCQYTSKLIYDSQMYLILNHKILDNTADNLRLVVINTTAIFHRL
jgi:hypothetical protein